MAEYKNHKSLSYNHRNASLCNEKEKHECANNCKFWDKCKEDVQHSFDRQEKALKQKLSLLKQEQEFYDKERSCLDVSSNLSLAEKTPLRRKSSSRYKIKQNQDADTSAPNAHDVAVRLLQSHSGKRVSTSFKEKTPIRDTENDKVRTGRTWPGTTTKKDGKLPIITVTKSTAYDDPKPEPSSRRRASRDASRVSRHKEGPEDHGLHPVERLHNQRRHTVSDVQADPQTTYGARGNHSTEDKSKMLSSLHTRRGSLDSRKHGIDSSVLNHYYKRLAQTENSFDVNDQDAHSSSYGPWSTFKRSQRRRTLALEEILKQLPSFKKKNPTFNPAELLRCSYLRLSQSNIESLEQMCRDEGYDPGIHVHMTVDQILEKFKEADLQLERTHQQEHSST